jgi:transposase
VEVRESWPDIDSGVTPSDLTDEEWTLVEPLLSRAVADERRSICVGGGGDAVLYVVRT